MTNDEFNGLSERILLALIRTPERADGKNMAIIAVQTADDLVKALNDRRARVRKETTLLPEEVLLCRDAPIAAIKSLRERTGLSLKEAKAIVDAERRKA